MDSIQTYSRVSIDLWYYYNFMNLDSTDENFEIKESSNEVKQEEKDSFDMELAMSGHLQASYKSIYLYRVNFS